MTNQFVWQENKLFLGDTSIYKYFYICIKVGNYIKLEDFFFIRVDLYLCLYILADN